MRRSACLLLTLLVLAGLTRALHAQSTLRYDGVYQKQGEEWVQVSRYSRQQVWKYLRFTPDGMAIPTSRPADRPERLGAFSLANLLMDFGVVTVRDGRISFIVSGCDGLFTEYEGHAEGDRLYLHVRSNYNGYEADEVYAFIPVPPEKMREWDSDPVRPDRPCGPPEAAPRMRLPPLVGKMPR